MAFEDDAEREKGNPRGKTRRKTFQWLSSLRCGVI